MENAIPTKPTSLVEAARLIPGNGGSGIDIASLSDQMRDAYRIAKSIMESMLDLTGDELRVVDAKRWALAMQLLRSADHELGRALR